jgi:acetolactate synthase-1/2/3 large subunit
MELTGSQIVIECLKEQGVDTVFGYPGGTILNIYDELYRHPEIHHILTSHEQGAAHAADGYARATGKTGVCMATSGPGATNLVTGIATAYMDSTPMVAITCNVGKALLGKDSFQEIDIAGVAMPITKYSVIVKDITVRLRSQRAEDRARFWSILQKMSQRQRMSTSRRLRRKLNRLLRELQKKAWITSYP